MKGIVVVDEIPKGCRSCCLMMIVGVFELRYMCAKYRNIIQSDIVKNGKKPDWCPIKPIPKRKTGRSLPEYDTDIHYEIGWNSCIDAITGKK